MISAPPEWLDRLLGVLLDNACRYTPPDGTVDVRVGRRDGRVRLAVEDSGPGIPAGERAHIFDRFRRASDAPGGSGLGLAIADAVVRGSGGRWEVGTSPSGGASMAVTWSPLIRGSAQAEETDASAGRSTASGALAPPPPPRTCLAQSSSLMLSATARGTSSLRDSTVAARMPSMLPKRRSSVRLRTGPSPGTVSRRDRSALRERRARWCVIAKRCASSRTRCTRKSVGLSFSMMIGRERPGANSSSLRLARPKTGTLPRPASRSTRWAAPSWPLPPSMSTRSGSTPKLSSRTRPSAVAVRRRLLRQLAVAPGGIVDRDVVRGRLVTTAAQQTRETPAQGLLHRGEVVAPLDGADAEMAVVRRPRTPVLEHDHRADRVGAHRVADVVALDASRRRRELEALREVDEERVGALGVEVVDDAALPQGAQRRGARLLDELPACSAARVAEVDRATALLGEELLDDASRPRWCLRRGWCAAGWARCCSTAGTKALRHSPALRSATPSSSCVSMPEDAAASHRQQRHHGTPSLEGNRHAVLVSPRAGEHLLALGDAVDGAEPVAETRRELEVEPAGGVLHLAAQLSVERVAAALHEELHLVEEGGVLGGVDAALARAAAPLDVVVEADTAAAEDVVAAGAEREDRAQRLHGAAQ